MDANCFIEETIFELRTKEKKQRNMLSLSVAVTATLRQSMSHLLGGHLWDTFPLSPNCPKPKKKKQIKTKQNNAYLSFF